MHLIEKLFFTLHFVFFLMSIQKKMNENHLKRETAYIMMITLADAKETLMTMSPHIHPQFHIYGYCGFDRKGHCEKWIVRMCTYYTIFFSWLEKFELLNKNLSIFMILTCFFSMRCSDARVIFILQTWYAYVYNI